MINSTKNKSIISNPWFIGNSLRPALAYARAKAGKVVFILLAFFQLSFLGAGAEAETLMPVMEQFKNPRALQQYQLRPKTELSKILFLVDLFKGSPLIVIYDGMEYDSTRALNFARKYLSSHYSRESAESWITQHAYRSNLKGDFIYLKDSDGTMHLLRDVLLNELKSLQPN